MPGVDVSEAAVGAQSLYRGMVRKKGGGWSNARRADLQNLGHFMAGILYLDRHVVIAA